MRAIETAMEPHRPSTETLPIEARLLRVQAASGVLFAVFLLLHLANQMIAALGPETYDRVQRTLRRGYQWAPIEIALVIAPLLVHAGTGFARMIVRRRRGEARKPASLATRLHRWSGVVLLVFFAGHVTATRGASLIYGIYPGFEGVAFTLRWVPAYFWPYYTTFALAGLYHLVHGLGVALPVLGVRGGSVLRRPRLLAVIASIGGIALVAGILAFGGVTRKPERDPRTSPYAALIRRLVARE